MFRRKLRSHRPSHATVVAYLALFVALGSTSAYAANTVFSTDIVDGEVKEADLANRGVTGPKLAVDSIGSSTVLNNSLRSADLGPESVGSSEVAGNSLSTGDLGPGSVGTSEVTDNSLLASDFKPGQLPAGSPGPQGDKGDPCLSSDPACRGPEGPPGLVNVTSFDGGSGVTSQPNGQKRTIMTAEGLPAGNYLVTFRTYIYPDQRYECGIGRGSVNDPAFVRYDTISSGGSPETMESIAVMTIYESNQDQLFYCNGFTDDWSAANPRLDFIKIDNITQGATG